MMLFLPAETWARLLIWLAVGMFIYFGWRLANHALAGWKSRRRRSTSDRCRQRQRTPVAGG
jgi:hypothetical protein